MGYYLLGVTVGHNSGDGRDRCHDGDCRPADRLVAAHEVPLHPLIRSMTSTIERQLACIWPSV
jgi:hypothetical protein